MGLKDLAGCPSHSYDIAHIQREKKVIQHSETSSLEAFHEE